MIPDETSEGFPSRQNAPKEPSGQATSIDDQIRYAYFTPPPTQYDPQSHKTVQGGLISSSIVPSQFDVVANNVRDNPGPATYIGSGEFITAAGGRVYAPRPQKVSEIDVSLLAALPDPGPGHFNPADPKKDETFGTFTKDRREPKYINDEVKRTRDHPSVGQYNTQQSLDYIDPFLPAGGAAACNQIKLPSYFDDVTKTHEFVPPPTEYALHGTFEVKPVGKPLYKYVSTTIEESKNLVRKALSTDVPGPGTYKLSELPPGKSSSFQSRTLPHGMPAPYNYNSQPDLCRKYVPLRQSNNADLIFGRNFRSKDSDCASINKSVTEDGSPAYKVKSTFSPAVSSVHSINSDASEVATALSDIHRGWVEGGFENAKYGLSKSKSVPVVEKPVHISVARAAQFYPPLAGHMYKPTTTFLPMAARRSIAIPTDSKSKYFSNYLLSKQCLKVVAQDLDEATQAALDPVDRMQLFRDATWLLRKKAQAQLRLEGLPKGRMREVTQESTAHLKSLLGMESLSPANANMQIADGKCTNIIS